MSGHSWETLALHSTNVGELASFYLGKMLRWDTGGDCENAVSVLGSDVGPILKQRCTLLLRCPGTPGWPKTAAKTTRTYPANTGNWNSVGLMLGQRRRRWPNIKTTLVQRIVFSWDAGECTDWWACKSDIVYTRYSSGVHLSMYSG